MPADPANSPRPTSPKQPRRQVFVTGWDENPPVGAIFRSRWARRGIRVEPRSEDRAYGGVPAAAAPAIFESRWLVLPKRGLGRKEAPQQFVIDSEAVPG